MKLKIGKKQYTLRYCNRALLVFEQITNRPFGLNSVTDWTVFAYALLLAGSPKTSVTLDAFIDQTTPADINQVAEWINPLLQIDNQFNEKDPDGIKKK